MTTRAFLRLTPALFLTALAAPGLAAESARDASASQPAAPADATATKRVDLNTADAAALETLPGIGTDYANAVIAARPFRSLDDLRRVRGVTPETIARLRDRVTVSPPPPPATAPAPTPMTPAGKPPQTNDGKAIDRKVVTERYDKATNQPATERK